MRKDPPGRATHSTVEEEAARTIAPGRSEASRPIEHGRRLRASRARRGSI
jgi:hypothetical protein